MNNLGRLVCLILCLFFSGFFTQIDAQSSKRQPVMQNQQAVTGKLRDFYLKHDFEGGVQFGKVAAAQHPNNIELQAWYLMNMARLKETNGEAIEQAKKFIAEKGETFWMLMALATAQSYKATLFPNPTYVSPEAALETTEKLIKLGPEKDEAVFTRNTALFYNYKFAESLRWLNDNLPQIKDKSQFYSRRAITKYMLMTNPKDAAARQKEIDDVYADFAKAVSLEPNSIEANYVHGKYLSRDKNYDNAVPFLKKSVRLSPYSLEIRKEFWNALYNQVSKTDAQKNAELTSELNSYLALQKNSPETLVLVAQAFNDFKIADRRDLLESRILKNYPNTKFEEEVVFAQQLRAADDKRIWLLWTYIARPVHFNERNLLSAYNYLSYSAGKDVSDEQLTQLIEGMLKYRASFGNVNTRIADILISGKTLRPNSKLNGDAEKYARAGIVYADEKALKLSPENAKAGQATAYNTLAEILTKNGNLDEAEHLLAKTEKLVAGDYPVNSPLKASSEAVNVNFARLYLAKKDYDRAEEYYLKDVENPNYAINFFKKLYKEKTGSPDGFDTYFTGIKEKIFQKRRRSILAARFTNAESLVPFNLKSLSDKNISLEDLKDKIIVINVWGTWCVPCVAEMPQFQELHKKYENDKDVAILTIDSEDEPANLRKFMAQNRYDFPVMLDDGYVNKIGKVKAFPTTFFIDKAGKIAFIKRGESDYLFEEFSWRIEALKGDK